MIKVFMTAALFTVLVGFAEAQPAGSSQPIDVPSLAGRSRTQLQAVFPGDSNEIRDWRGWKQVRLDFNEKGRLVAITFTPTAPITEIEATGVLQDRFKVELQRSAYVSAPAIRAWRDMKGPVRTVNLFKADGPGYRVCDIGIFFVIADRE